MPMLNFQSRFAPLVECGEKRQTIRAYRKDGRDPKVGDRLYLYTGARTKACRKLGEATAEKVRAVAIHRTRHGERLYLEGWDQDFQPTLDGLAQSDGFRSWHEMVAWFEKTHGLPFRGLLIEWDSIEREG